jgi:uncharacterized protein (TIGR02145 family)
MKKYNLTNLLILLMGILTLFSCSSDENSNNNNNCNQTYKTVVIGTQTWLAENVNCPTSSGSKCYDDDPTNCSKYGRLYDWETAMTVCPSGFHLPRLNEWAELIGYAGGLEEAGNKLKATSGWNEKSGNGTDELEFSALAGGSYSSRFSYFTGIGDYGHWWSSGDLLISSEDSSSSYSLEVGNIVLQRYLNKSNLFSVRCIKN